MTAAEAREIEDLEFEAEREAIRQRALAIVQAHRAQAKARAEALAKLGKGSPIDQRPRSKDKRNPFNRASPGAKAQTYTHNGLALTLAEWGDRLGVSVARLSYRLKHGWPLDRVFIGENRRGLGKPSSDTPVGPPTYTHNGLTLTLNEWSERLGITCSTLRDRRRRGLPVDQMLSVRKLHRGRPRHRGVSEDLGKPQGTDAGSTAQEIS